MFDGKFRQSADAAMAPVGRALGKAGLSADVLTASGFVFALATAGCIAAGLFWQAIILLVLSGALDLLDGAVAKATHRTSKRGGFFDSVVDRWSDAAMLGGVAYYLSAHHHGTLVMLPFGLVTTFLMISYQRSKAESLGIPAKGGLMERAERLVLLGVALLSKTLFIPVLWVLLALTTMTMLGRFYRVWQAAERPAPVASSTPRHYGERLRRRVHRTSRH
jgi:CDP-diacylglycerol--glycerol-3-phosphate 3-phosphatidyltransferase